MPGKLRLRILPSFLLLFLLPISLPAVAQKTGIGVWTGAGLWHLSDDPASGLSSSSSRVVWSNALTIRRQLHNRLIAELGLNRVGWKDSVRIDAIDYQARYRQRSSTYSLSLGIACRLFRCGRGNLDGVFLGAGVSRMLTGTTKKGVYYPGWLGPREFENDREHWSGWGMDAQLSGYRTLYKNIALQARLHFGQEFSSGFVAAIHPQPATGFDLQAGVQVTF